MTVLTIIMPCYNRGYDLLRILQAYDCQTTDQPFEIIAVDDASKDNTYQVLSSFQPQHYKLSIIRLEKNQGPGNARNQGISRVESPLIAFVGDDIFPSPGFVEGHLKAHTIYTDHNTAILGQITWPDDLPCNTLMSHIDGVGAQQFSYYYFRDRQAYDYRHLYTSNISLKTAFLQSLDHWFDTDFYLAAFEDVELGYRLSLKGLQIIYFAPILAYHFHYHSIWSFSARQFNGGLMAAILLRKHPELAFSKPFRTFPLRVLRLIAKPALFSKPYTPQMLMALENMARRLAGAYEWSPNKLLDSLYLSLLEYFFYDGYLVAALGRPLYDRWAHSLHAKRYLLPALENFQYGACENQIPLPGSYNGNMLSLFH